MKYLVTQINHDFKIAFYFINICFIVIYVFYIIIYFSVQKVVLS
jgi:ABC-type multidrug transport system permease subunit